MFFLILGIEIDIDQLAFLLLLLLLIFIFFSLPIVPLLVGFSFKVFFFPQAATEVAVVNVEDFDEEHEDDDDDDEEASFVAFFSLVESTALLSEAFSIFVDDISLVADDVFEFVVVDSVEETSFSSSDWQESFFSS